MSDFQSGTYFTSLAGDWKLLQSQWLNVPDDLGSSLCLPDLWLDGSRLFWRVGAQPTNV